MLPLNWKFKEIFCDNKPKLILEYFNDNFLYYYTFQKLKEYQIGDIIINKNNGLKCQIIVMNEKIIIGKIGRFEITFDIDEFFKEWEKN